MSCYNSAGETNVLQVGTPLGKARLWWRRNFSGKRNFSGEILRVREVIASSFTGDEKRGHPLSLGMRKYASEYPSYVNRNQIIVPLMKRCTAVPLTITHTNVPLEA